MLKLSDNGFGTLGAPLTAGAVSLSLTAGHGLRFPALAAGDVLPLCLVDANGLEEVIATAKATDTLTIVRAMGGTSARAFSAGSKVQCRLSSEALLRLTAEAGRGIDVTGTNTYVGTWAPAPIGYVKGVLYRIIIANANTGASTLNIGGLGAIAIRKNVNQALTAGDLPAGHVAEMVYDGTNMQLLNPATSVWKPGDIKYSATPDDEEGWLGFTTAAVSRTTYAGLFAKLVKLHTGTTVNGNAVVTAMDATADLKVGQRVFGTGIRPGTRIQSIDGAAQITMTKTASASNVGTALQFHWWGIGDGVNDFNLPGPGRSPVSAGAGNLVATFASADISTGGNTASSGDHQFLHGMQATFNVLTGSAPTTSPAGLLDNGDTVFIYVSDADTIAFATSAANIVASNVIDITAAGAGTYSVTHALTNRVVGQSLGEEKHLELISEMPSHNHPGSTMPTSTTSSPGTFALHGNAFEANQPISIAAQGGSTPMNIVDPGHVMYGKIKT